MRAADTAPSADAGAEGMSCEDEWAVDNAAGGGASLGPFPAGAVDNAASNVTLGPPASGDGPAVNAHDGSDATEKNDVPAGSDPIVEVGHGGNVEAGTSLTGRAIDVPGGATTSSSSDESPESVASFLKISE